MQPAHEEAHKSEDNAACWFSQGFIHRVVADKLSEVQHMQSQTMTTELHESRELCQADKRAA
jgi:hypothetical protein